MRFHCLLVVRDEGDFIAESLGHLLMWCDTVAVLDTGSSDGTWEIIQNLAARDRRFISTAREPVFFDNALRPYLFERVRHHFRTGDWVVRLDADEVAHIPPPEFVRARLRAGEDRVHGQMYEFVLLRGEAEAEEPSPHCEGGVSERRRWYFVDPFAEMRMFRYRRRMKWPYDRYEPLSAGVAAAARLPIRHYRGRSPSQLRQRCALRSLMAEAREVVPTHHWRHAADDWRYWVWEEDRAGLRYWAPGSELEEVHDRSHVHQPGVGIADGPLARQVRRVAGGAGVRLAERMLHRSRLVHIRDMLRAGRANWEPRPIPADVQRRLEVELRGAEARCGGG